jgi:hypothetical protein
MEEDRQEASSQEHMARTRSSVVAGWTDGAGLAAVVAGRIDGGSRSERGAMCVSERASEWGQAGHVVWLSLGILVGQSQPTEVIAVTSVSLLPVDGS